MKKTVILLMLLGTTTLFAQSKNINFGVKAGLNYGDNGKIEINDLTNAGENIIKEDASSRTGYHLGIFVRANLTDNFYIKPELQYTKTKSQYEITNSKADYDISKLDLPILAGVKIIGPLHVFGGPSLQYILDNDLDVDNVSIGDVENDFTVGVQFGAGIQLGRINADVRYERGLSKNQAQTITDNIGQEQEIRVDSRANQFILSLALDF